MAMWNGREPRSEREESERGMEQRRDHRIEKYLPRIWRGIPHRMSDCETCNVVLAASSRMAKTQDTKSSDITSGQLSCILHSAHLHQAG